MRNTGLLLMAMLLSWGCRPGADLAGQPEPGADRPSMDLTAPVTEMKPGAKPGSTDVDGVNCIILPGLTNSTYNHCLISFQAAHGSPAAASLILNQNGERVGRAVLKGQECRMEQQHDYVFEFELSDALLRESHAWIQFRQGEKFSTYRFDLSRFPKIPRPARK